MSGYWPPTSRQALPRYLPTASGPPTTAAENLSAAWDDMRTSNISTSHYRLLEEAYAARAQDIYSKTGKRLTNPVSMRQDGDFLPAMPGPFDLFVPGELERSRRPLMDRFETEVDGLRAEHPDLMTRDQMLQSISEKAQGVEQRHADIASRATFWGKVGDFAGGMAGAVSDPVNLASLALGAPASASILRVALTEAAIGAATEVATQPQIQTSRVTRGQEGGIRQGAENVAFAAAGGAAAGAVIHGIGRLAGRRLLEQFDREIKNPSPGQKEARDLYARVTEINGDSPLDSDIPESVIEHNDRLARAMAELESGGDFGLTPRAATPVSARALDGAAALDNLDGVISRFDPEDLLVDAKTFQFKEGGDDAGVTERLKGVQRWDPVKAGQVIVFEDDAGRRFIADGHQRVGLARRIAASDPSQQPRLYGTLLRAADGYTAEDARVIAAMKNIAEGTGTAVDAAKVLRADPGRIAELPPRSALVRQAADMTELSDSAFGLVVNEVVPAHYAAIVGRLVKDPQMQEAIMQVLARVAPENAVQAEGVVRQAMEAGTRTEVQQGLFGEEMITSSLYGERAKVLDKALKKLRQDASVFQTLVRNEDDIAAAGNVLTRDVNAARADIAARAAQMIQTLAHRKGPLSDALTAAARRAADEGRYGNATNDFADAVRRAVEQGDFNGVSPGRAGSAYEAEAENAARAAAATDQNIADESLALFDEPAGRGAEQQTRALEADLTRQIDAQDAGAVGDGDGPGGILDAAVPDGLAVDPETGAVVARTRTIREILDDIDRDADDLTAIGKCGQP